MGNFVFIKGKRFGRPLLFLSLLIIALLWGGFYAVKTLKHDKEMRALGEQASGKVIIVDPGHGGIDGGSSGKSGSLEKDITMPVAQKVAKRLESSGATVVLTRQDKPEQADPSILRRQGQELARRARLVEEHRAQTYVSIHVNSIPSPKWSGAQTFFQPQSQDSQRLALLIQQELIKQVDEKNNRKARPGDYYVLNRTACPAVLVEIGFLSNPQEEMLLKGDAYQEKLASAIWTGICRYWAGEQPPPPKP